MNPVLTTAIAAITVWVALGLLARAKPSRLDPSGGEIGPSWLMQLTGLVSLLLAGLAGYGFVLSGQMAALALAVGFGCSGAWLAYRSLPIFRVRWNEQGISGPSSLFFSPQRVTIPWDDIQTCTITLAGSVQVEAADGRKIGWSTGFSGYELPMDELRKRKPTIFA